jgi:polyisoprenoid-binding protein YceI
MKTFITLAAAAATLISVSSAQAQSATYAIDPTHTFVTFEVQHFGTSTNRGRFDKKEGTVTFDRAGKSGKVDISIDAASLSTGTGPFDKHLQSKDFFNVAEHPKVTFSGDKFSFNGDKVTEVAGMLTLLGKTLPVTLKASNFNCYQSPIIKREVCGGDFETTIDRVQWGMGTYVPPGQPGNVKLVIQVEAVKQ